MITLDLFETPGTPEEDPRPQAQYVPVNPEKPGSRNRALGNANLAILMKAINNVDMNNRPAPLPAKLNFLDGRSYTIDPKYYPAIIGYYRSINDVERVNFIYRTMVSYNKTIKFLNTLSQGTLFEKEEKKSSKYKDVAVQRAMRQAKADFPSAASDTEAFAKSMMVQQDQDQKAIDRLKSASQRNQELINKNDELDQTQARSIDAIQQEINRVEKDNDSLTSMVQQMSRANAELQDKLARMRGKTTAEPAPVAEPNPQLGVSVATDKLPAQATVGGEPAEILPSSPIDIGARQKIKDLGKSVTDALLRLKDKEQTQGLSSSEQERLEKLEKRLGEIEKAQSLIKTARQRGEKQRKKAGDAAISAIAKAMGGETTASDVKAVEPTNIQPAPTTTTSAPKSNVVQLRKREPDVIPDLVIGQTNNQSTATQPEVDLLGQKVGEDLTHGLEEGSVFGQQDFETQRELAKMKSDLAQEKLPQTAPQPSVAPQAQPQPVAYKSPERLSDLQARHQKVEALFNLKKAIEIAKDKATKGGRILPRGLAADLEDYYSMDDIDTHFDQMLAAYQKQLKAIEQYRGMKKILNKKVTHEMRASELEESKESKAWEQGGREGYYHRPNKNPYKPGTQEHADYNRGYEHFKGDKDWDAPKRRLVPEDTKSEFKAAALVKIKRALDNPKLDPATRKDYETRLKKIQDLEEAKWKKETPWVKSTGKDPRGEVTHMSDVARKETERREREDSPMGQLFKDFEKVFGKKPPVKEGDVVNINRGGYNEFRDKNDFLDKRDYVQQQLLDPRQRDNHAELKQRLQDINYAGRKLGYIK